MAKKQDEEYEVNDHQLSVSSVRTLYKLVKDNKIDKKYRGRLYKILVWTILTQPLHFLQKALIYPKLKAIDFDKTPPIFVLGHWRSGTTHLHYLLARDPQLGYLTNYQGLFMRMSFVGKGWMDKIVDHFMPETRPQDNILMTAYEPAEEEQPLTNLTYASGMQSFFFPKNRSYHDKYNLFKGISDEEKKEWQKKYKYMLKLISLENKGKPILLKNPHNTGRVKELLELFPKARFIFLHRNPFDVYLSTRHLYKKMIQTQFLQEFSDEEVIERILYAYSSTLTKYLDERALIPKDQLVEISFNELEENGLETTEKIYKSLGLPNYKIAKPEFEKYLKDLKNYKKNKFKKIDPAIEARIKSEWKFAFEEWNYPLERVNEEN